MKSTRPTLAVFGGSFNPPHVGHVLLPAWLLALGFAHRVLVAPCETHALGKALPPFAQRLDWTRAAMAQHGDTVVVSEIERTLARERAARGEDGPSYALHLLQRIALDHPAFRVRMVVGSDIIESGETARWHRWDLIERDFSPIVVPRSGPASLGALPEVSSSQIRATIASALRSSALEPLQEALRGLVPANVLALLLPPRRRVLILGRGHASTQIARWLRSQRVHVEICGARESLRDSSVLDDALVRATSLNVPCGAMHFLEEAPDRARSLPASGDRAGLDAVFVVTREQLIGPLDELLARRLSLRTVAPRDPTTASVAVSCVAPAVFQCAGQTIAAQVFPRCVEFGIPVATAHPICVLRADLHANPLGSTYWGVEGDARALQWLSQFVGEERCLVLDGLDVSQRAAYHAACSLDANYLAVLLELARASMRAVGLPSGPVAAATLQLMASSLAALHELGFPAGVSGPVARGDEASVAAHLRALTVLSEDPAAAQEGAIAAEVYRVLAGALALRLTGPTATGPAEAV